MSSLCIDIGATKVLIGILNDDFEEIIEKYTEKFLHNIEKEIEILSNKVDSERAFIAAAGPVDEEKGVIYPPNISKDKIHITKRFGSLFDQTILINDCNAAVLGEYNYGIASVENLIYLSMSTGIGAGVIADGSLIRGSTNNFAEVGHMKIAEEGKCGCGRIGHWEGLCSGKNIPKVAEKEIGEHFEGTKEVFEKYIEGDERVKAVLDRVIDYNSTAISNLINLYDPAHISIGGSMGLNQFDVLIDKDKIKKEVIYNMPSIEKSSLGKEAVLYGLKSILKKD
ncbi:MAG: ROK family protein [Candidatus Natronoplasma sp.]